MSVLSLSTISKLNDKSNTVTVNSPWTSVANKQN